MPEETKITVHVDGSAEADKVVAELKRREVSFKTIRYSGKGLALESRYAIIYGYDNIVRYFMPELADS